MEMCECVGGCGGGEDLDFGIGTISAYRHRNSSVRLRRQQRFLTHVRDGGLEIASPSYVGRRCARRRLRPSIVRCTSFFFLFFPLLFYVVCTTGPHPPLRLASRPNRGHIGGGGWTPSCGTCLRCFYRGFMCSHEAERTVFTLYETVERFNVCVCYVCMSSLSYQHLNHVVLLQEASYFSGARSGGRCRTQR